MTAIIGWSHLLREGGLDEQSYESAVEAIVRSAHAQAMLIDDVLDMSRIIAGKMQLNPEAVDVANIVQAALHTVRPAADAKGVTVEFQQRPGASLVTGDANRLQQVVWNLLSNSIKFTPRGGEVVARVEQSGSFVRISVRDTGKGITSDFLPHIFEPFRQAENVTTRAHGGLGLGLTIVKQLVELHGGNISAHSAGEGKGATFIVELPVRALRSVDAPSEPLRRYTSTRPPQDPAAPQAAYPSLAGVHVLVVDDQEDARMLVNAVLTRCGARVTLAASVADALRFVTTEKIDIILSDIAMPDADGFELIRTVRAWKMNMPVLAMTAFGGPADQDKILASGFTGYLRKPVEPADLAREIFTVVRRAQSRPPAAS